MIKFKNILIMVILVGITIFTFNFLLKYSSYKAKEAERWQNNYQMLSDSIKISRDEAGYYRQQATVLRMTYEEFKESSYSYINELKRQLELSDIKIKNLISATSMVAQVHDTLKLDPETRNDTTFYHYSDSLSKVEIILYPDYTTQVMQTIVVPIHTMMYIEHVPKHEKETKLGKKLQNTAMKCKMTSWLVRKKVLYRVEVKTTNPNAIIKNTQSLTIIKQ